MYSSIDIKELHNIVSDIRILNNESFSQKKIVLQGEARRILPKLSKHASSFPDTIFTLRSFRDNPFAKISDSIIVRSLGEIRPTRKITPRRFNSPTDSKKPEVIPLKRPESKAKTNNHGHIDTSISIKPQAPTKPKNTAPTPLVFAKSSNKLIYDFNIPQKPTKETINFKEKSAKENLESNTYRIKIDFDNELFFIKSCEHIKSWLHEKKGASINFDKEVNFQSEKNDSHISIQNLFTADKKYQRVLIFEKTKDLEFHTEILISSSNEYWIWIQSESNRELVAMPPAFIKDLLPLSSNIIKSVEYDYINDSHDLDLLIEKLEDPSRKTPIFVIPTESSDENFRYVAKQAKDFFRAVIGIGEIFLLTDKITEEYNDKYPYEGYSLKPWSIRVFNPGLDFEDTANSQVHRSIGSKRVLDKSLSRQNKFLIARIARSIANTETHPREISFVKNEFNLKINRELLYGNKENSSIRDSAKPKFGSESYKNQSLPFELDFSIQILEAVKNSAQMLEVKQINEDFIYDLADAFDQKQDFENRRFKIEQKLNDQQQEISQLSYHLEFNEAEREELENNITKIDDENFQLNKQIQFLQSKLVSSGQGKDAFAYNVLEDDQPENFVELIERLNSGKLEFVKFTGDVKVTTALDDLDAKSTAVKSAWRTLFCLNDYGRFKRDSGKGNIYNYLRTHHQGYFNVGLSNYRASESESTMQQYGFQRLFKVPLLENHPEATVYMQTHFKIKSTDFGTKEPRLYLYDSTDTNGEIYIGYIGPHLDTKSTN